MKQVQRIVDFYSLIEIDPNLNPNNPEFVKGFAFSIVEKTITSL
jgi:hypothetical protein